MWVGSIVVLRDAGDGRFAVRVHWWGLGVMSVSNELAQVLGHASCMMYNELARPRCMYNVQQLAL